MFLVPVEIVSFYVVHHIVLLNECEGGEGPTSVKMHFPVNSTGMGVGWYSRADILRRVIPNLQATIGNAAGGANPYNLNASDFALAVESLWTWYGMVADTYDELDSVSYFLLDVFANLAVQYPSMLGPSSRLSVADQIMAVSVGEAEYEAVQQFTPPPTPSPTAPPQSASSSSGRRLSHGLVSNERDARVLRALG